MSPPVLYYYSGASSSTAQRTSVIYIYIFDVCWKTSRPHTAPFIARHIIRTYCLVINIFDTFKNTPKSTVEKWRGFWYFNDKSLLRSLVFLRVFTYKLKRIYNWNYQAKRRNGHTFKYWTTPIIPAKNTLRSARWLHIKVEIKRNWLDQ